MIVIDCTRVQYVNGGEDAARNPIGLNAQATGIELAQCPRRRGGRSASGQFALTAAEVARAAGVSRSVVSRAFTPGRADRRGDPRAMFRRSRRRLGYSPNIIARSLITRRSDLIAVVVNTLSDLRDASFFDALFAALQTIGKQALIVRTHAADDLAQILRVGVSYQIAGALVFADNVTPAMVKAIFRSVSPIMLNGLERPSDKSMPCASTSARRSRGGRRRSCRAAGTAGLPIFPAG